MASFSRNCRHRISKFRRSWVFYLDGHECVYCGNPGKTLDHLIPVSVTPRRPAREVNAFSNLVTACNRCNNVKDNNPSRFTPRYGRFVRYRFLEPANG